MAVSAQLYQIAQGLADANGNLVLTIPGPRLTRIWQGTISIIGPPQGSQWLVTIGAQQMGLMNAPGPAGPFQLLLGQNATVVGAGLTVGLSCLAVLVGVDDPADNATSYTGPTIPSATAVTSNMALPSFASNGSPGPLTSGTNVTLTTPSLAEGTWLIQVNYLMSVTGSANPNVGSFSPYAVAGTAVATLVGGPTQPGGVVPINTPVGSGADTSSSFIATIFTAGTLVFKMVPTFSGAAYQGGITYTAVKVA